MGLSKLLKGLNINIFFIVIFIFIISFAIIIETSNNNCDLLLCKYPLIKTITVNILNIFFYPILIIFKLIVTHFKLNPIGISYLILFFIMIWLVIASYILSKLFIFLKIKIFPRLHKKKRPKKKVNFQKEYQFLSQLFITLNTLFIISLILLGILFYPRINVSIGFNEYVITSGFLVALLTLFITLKKPEDNFIKKAERNLISCSLFLLVLSFLGVILNFFTLVNPSELFLDRAFLNGFNLGFFGGTLMGLFSIMFLIMYLYLKIIKTKT